MTNDPSKHIIFYYDTILNLPLRLDFGNGSLLFYDYTADGNKLIKHSKPISGNGVKLYPLYRQHCLRWRQAQLHYDRRRPYDNLWRRIRPPFFVRIRPQRSPGQQPRNFYGYRSWRGNRRSTNHQLLSLRALRVSQSGLRWVEQFLKLMGQIISM
jgi:hypothetical protein